jgi:hypothetical protein
VHQFDGVARSPPRLTAYPPDHTISTRAKKEALRRTKKPTLIKVAAPAAHVHPAQNGARAGSSGGSGGGGGGRPGRPIAPKTKTKRRAVSPISIMLTTRKTLPAAAFAPGCDVTSVLTTSGGGDASGEGAQRAALKAAGERAARVARRTSATTQKFLRPRAGKKKPRKKDPAGDGPYSDSYSDEEEQVVQRRPGGAVTNGLDDVPRDRETGARVHVMEMHIRRVHPKLPGGAVITKVLDRGKSDTLREQK